jgi:hypothetical protein
MFTLAEQVDTRKSAGSMAMPPDGEHLRLRTVELEARDLERFKPGQSIAGLDRRVTGLGKL